MSPDHKADLLNGSCKWCGLAGWEHATGELPRAFARERETVAEHKRERSEEWAIGTTVAVAQDCPPEPSKIMPGWTGVVEAWYPNYNRGVTAQSTSGGVKLRGAPAVRVRWDDEVLHYSVIVPLTYLVQTGTAPLPDFKAMTVEEADAWLEEHGR